MDERACRQACRQAQPRFRICRAQRCYHALAFHWASKMFQFASEAEQFRAKATVCLARSKRVPDPQYQRIFYDLAIEWLALAAEADCKEKASSLSQVSSPVVGAA